MRAALVPAAAAAAAVAVLAGCGGGGGATTTRTVQETTRVEVVRDAGGGAVRFDPEAIYRREAPGVVTVISLFGSGSGQGSGFVISGDGEIATNAHVVTDGEGADIRLADRVYVQFADRNQVPARIVGFDANADVALLRIDPAGLTLRPLPFGRLSDVHIGEPVAAIGSPFGEPQSLSVGVVSALDRSIESLNGFSISGAIQTDAAINRGNSGGPLLDAAGHVVGINSQIRSTSGGGTGVGFAVDADTVRHSLAELRAHGRVRYSFLGVTTTTVYPQLAQRFHLGTESGAWVQDVAGDGPAARAGIRGGTGGRVRFQSGLYEPGGDVIVAVAGRPVRRDNQLGHLLQAFRPGETVTLDVRRGAERRAIRVRLGERPAATGP